MASGPPLVLSSNDTLVLTALFDPETSLSNSKNSSTTESEPINTKSNIDPDTLRAENEALKLLNSSDPSLTTTLNAVSKLDGVCQQAPHYASGWCNRAQATRLYLTKTSARQEGETESQYFLRLLTENPQRVQQLFDDLAKATSLAHADSTNFPSSCESRPIGHETSTSTSDFRVLAAAHTHRGYLLWLLSRLDEYDPSIFPSPLTGMSHQQLEEMANKEFALGGKYGNQIAKQVSVKTNPYAKLCGSIVQEAMRKELLEHCTQSLLA